MQWSESIVVDRPLPQVQQAIADEHELMQWSAWPQATGFTCAVDGDGDGDGRSLGSAIVFSDRKGVEQGRQRLTRVLPDRVEYRLPNRVPGGLEMTPEVDFRLETLGPSVTRVHLDFRAAAPLPPGLRQLAEAPARTPRPRAARGGPPAAEGLRRAAARSPVSTHSGPVPASAWAADAVARARGRVEMFNASRPGGLDRWTMDLEQYELMRAHILGMLDEQAGEDGTLLLSELVAAAQDRYAAHPAFPNGRLRNYCTYTEVDLEARCLIERIPGSQPQRVRRRPAASTPVTQASSP